MKILFLSAVWISCSIVCLAVKEVLPLGIAILVSLVSLIALMGGVFDND